MVNRDPVEYQEPHSHPRLLVESLLENPVEQFKIWFQEAESAGVPEPNIMTLATVNKGIQPSLRVVLMKEITDQGIVFYTNFRSRKAREMDQHPRAALNFFWYLLNRQVRLEGDITKVPDHKSDAYFRTRPRGSQLGAWVSEQSEAIPSREFLEKELSNYQTKFEGQDIPRPPHWGGYLLTPHRVEFWQAGEHRLHDRVQYTLSQGDWERCRLAP
jgi:pyridoxamine 5'-phosphate oxidase